MMRGSVPILPLLLLFVLATAAADRFGPRFDWTGEGEHTLAPRTVEILRSLPGPVEATAFYRPEDPRTEPIRRLLDRAAAATPRFTFRIVDPDRRPGEARRYGVSVYGTTTIDFGERRERIYNYGERDLAAALLRLTAPEKTIRFLAGQGEKEPGDRGDGDLGGAADALEREGFRVETLLLAGEERVPEGTAAVIAAGPLRDPLPGVADRLEAYVRAGGGLFLLLDPESGGGWNDFLRRFGLEAGREVVVDPGSRLYGVDMQMPAVEDYDRHDSVRGLRGASFFPRARPVARAGGGGPDELFLSLARSREESWAETDSILLARGKAVFDEGADRPGPLVLGGVYYEKGTTDGGVIVLFGDSDFASNRFRSLGANGDLFLGAARWIADRGGPLGVDAPAGEDEPLLLSPRRAAVLLWVCVILPPALIALAGAATVLRWRTRG